MNERRKMRGYGVDDHIMKYRLLAFKLEGVVESS